jgi:23S rRNA pseudouridine2605 synthase
VEIIVSDQSADQPDKGERRPPRSSGDNNRGNGAAARRDDRARGTDRPQRSDAPRSDRPRTDRPQRSDRPARSGDRPSSGDRPQRSDRPAWQKDRPASGDRPQRSDRPARSGDRPSSGDRPQRSDRPAWQKDRPASGDRPQRSDRPARSGDRPSSGDRPDRGNRTDRGHSSERGGRPDRGRDSGGRELWTRDGAPARGDRDAFRRERELTEEERIAFELKSIRPRHDDPEIPDDVTPQDLDKGARNELKTLSKENADGVAQHLAMAARLIDSDPALAHLHAMSAARRAGRIAMVRETLAITAYETGDYALALRELRTYRRISGKDDQLPLMVDSERGVGRPERALELGRSVDRSTLDVPVRVALAIAMSGARLDLGQTEDALLELQIPQLDPKRAFSYSPALFNAYAETLEVLGRGEEAAVWHDRAMIASEALEQSAADDEGETMVVVEELLEFDDEPESPTADAAASDDQPGEEPSGESAADEKA